MSQSQERVFFPGLNGIRALAAFSVLLAHIDEYKWRFHLDLPPMAPKVLLNGINAVVMFFVLSGFLITYLLLVEIQKSGTVSVRKFYMRRALRIWPVYFLTVFIGLVVVPLVVQWTQYQGFYPPTDVSPLQVGLYLLLLPNAVGFFGPAAVALQQLWSIGVEEQFYLVWPVLTKLTAKRILVAIIGVIVVKLLLVEYQSAIVVDQNYSQTYRNFIAFLNNLRFENMAVGGLGAWILFHRHWLLKMIFHPIVEKLALGFMLYNVLFLNPPDDPRLNFWLTIPYIIFILNVSSNPRSTLKLENRLFDWLGRLSYGIYMYHLPIVYLVFLSFSFVNIWTWNNWVYNAVIYSLIIGLTLAASEASYRWFERPFLRLKNRFTVVKSGMAYVETTTTSTSTAASVIPERVSVTSANLESQSAIRD
ncbi:MAG: acyltransferase [Anaerolineae bacterium]